MIINNFLHILILNIGTGAAPGQAFCNRTCVNGGVCNIVNNQQVCWCTLGFSGSYCELQG